MCQAEGHKPIESRLELSPPLVLPPDVANILARRGNLKKGYEFVERWLREHPEETPEHILLLIRGFPERWEKERRERTELIKLARKELQEYGINIDP